MEKRLREISRFFVVPRREFAPAVRARPRTPFSINTSTSVRLGIHRRAAAAARARFKQFMTLK